MCLCSILIRTLSLIPASGAQILLKTSSQIDLDLFAVGDRDSLCHRNECKSAALTSHPPVQLSALLPSHSHRVDQSRSICTHTVIRNFGAYHAATLSLTSVQVHCGFECLAQICNYNFAPSCSFQWRRFPLARLAFFVCFCLFPVAAAI